jgi:PAS domain S-box-containing protein
MPRDESRSHGPQTEEREPEVRDERLKLRMLVADAILNAAADAVVACDRDGNICFWNPSAERLFGYSGDEAMGRSLDLIIPERLRQRHWDGFGRVMQTGQTRYGESDVLAVPALRKDDATISVEFAIYPLKSEGRIIGIAAIMRDVTMRFNEMRALRRKLADVVGTSTEKA